MRYRKIHKESKEDHEVPRTKFITDIITLLYVLELIRSRNTEISVKSGIKNLETIEKEIFYAWETRYMQKDRKQSIYGDIWTFEAELMDDKLWFEKN
jgi:hypothetical protein